MNKKIKKFNKFELIFFRIHLVVVGVVVFLLTIMFLIQSAIDSLSNIFLVGAYMLFYVVIFNFLISVIRLLKYLFTFKDEKSKPSIKRTISIILTSPIALALYFIITIVMSLSLASCSI